MGDGGCEKEGKEREEEERRENTLIQPKFGEGVKGKVETEQPQSQCHKEQ